MKLIVATFVTANLISTATMAFEITGGSLVLNENTFFADATATDWGNPDVQGMLAFSISSGLGGQIGLSTGQFYGWISYLNGDAHLTYAVSPEVTLGAFIGQESWDSDLSDVERYRNFGVEAAYTKNALTVQTAAASFKGITYSDYSGTALIIDTVYGLNDSVSLTGGLHFLTETVPAGYYSQRYAYIGAGYAVTPKVTLNVTYGLVDYDGGSDKHPTVSLGLTYNFRTPAVFQQRNYNSIIPD